MKVVQSLFIPIFLKLVQEIISPQKNPEMFGNILLQMYRYFQEYEYKETFKSELVWNEYKSFILKAANHSDLTLSDPDIYGLVQSLG